MTENGGLPVANGGHPQFWNVDHGANQDNSTLQKRLARARELTKQDPQLQEARLDRAALERITSAGNTSIEIVATMFKEYATRTLFGVCAPGESTFHTVTYGEVWERIQVLAAGWEALGMVHRGDFVGISGFASVDWVVSDYATLHAGGVMVPLPTNILAEDVRVIIMEAEVRCLMLSAQELIAVAAIIKDCACVRAVVVMDNSTDEVTSSGAYAEMQANLPEGCKLTTVDEVIAAGRAAGGRPKMVIPGRDGQPSDPLVNLMYTSGSSGRPKGAEYHEHLSVAFLKDPMPAEAPEFPVICMGFLPLNHLMGRMTLTKSLLTGGQTWFVRSTDMSTFFDDLKIIRPTEAMFPPRILNMLHDRFEEQLERLPPAATEAERAKQRQDLIKQFREVDLGGRMFSGTFGSAPASPEVIQWLEEVLGFPPINGYGSTEGGMIMLDNKIQHRLVPAYKLVDVPELGYTTKDKPYPRGELRIKTTRMISGYYKHPEATAELFDEEGFLKTGDVVEQRDHETFIWLDRVKNIIKLAQGEYVSVSRLEEIYVGNSKLVHQMYIYGNSLRAYLVAIVVPNLEVGRQMEPGKLKAALRTELDDVARRKALQGYEIPREFIVELHPFSKDNHLLTDSNKPARGQLKKRYQAELEGLYTALEERLKERLRAMKEGKDASVQDRIKQALEVTLGLADEDMVDIGSRSFAQLGGDSLAAIQFARYVGELCGVNLPVSFVLDHSHSLQAIADRVQELVSGDASAGITFESIHGSDGVNIKAADLKLERFLSEADLAAAAAAAPASELPAQPTRVLLTGANGFLGRFLLLDLLQRVSHKEGGRVVAIVRGSSDEKAAERLRSGFDSGDPQLLQRFDALSKHLVVYAGDLAQPQLGLSQSVYDSLCAELDTIVHNGALVNHAYSYEQLFEPNVLGSVEVMRVAMAKRKKELTFISSVGVVGGLDHPQSVMESEDGPALCDVHPGDGGYAIGYGCSKWACEVLLKQLHERFGVPVKIFRCGMILSHTTYLGQINPTDFFTRLLCGIAYTGIAPESFYTLPHGPEEHFDGMPIDFVSGVIAATTANERTGFDTYHVVNPHWTDGVSLDRIVDWVESAGYPVSHSLVISCSHVNLFQ
ncbi:Carboxylic acid reductase [Coccomyxa sp. Obi]|nr:Carboxylic acid reductase [Coccomyxa sp. Obi]